MDRIRLLRNPIRSYAWGSRTALAELTGRPSPSPEPEAELWMGAHPSAPSELRVGDGWIGLDAWIARAPAAVLGEAVARRFGGSLPFLFKVLAPARALSIQTHPDREQARRGFERENAAGIALDDPRRSYRDPNPKPELICALTRFEALCGFRQRAEIASGLAALEVPLLAATLTALRSSEPGGLRRAFEGLMTLPAAQRRAVADAVAEAAAAKTAKSADDPARACVARLAAEFPGDIGILAPLWLNRVDLAPGEALFLAAGELHAYLGGGVGIELMGNSDNVLRGGLTPKHVDVDALLATLHFREGAPEILRAEEQPSGALSYATPADEFELSRVEVAADTPYEVRARTSVEIVLCTHGRLCAIDPAHAESVPLPRGAAVLLPASLATCRIEGEGTLYVAGVAR